MKGTYKPRGVLRKSYAKTVTDEQDKGLDGILSDEEDQMFAKSESNKSVTQVHDSQGNLIARTKKQTTDQRIKE